MKAQTKSVRKNKNIDVLISFLSEKEILSIKEMICVRGGDGETSEPPILNVPKI